MFGSLNDAREQHFLLALVHSDALCPFPSFKEELHVNLDHLTVHVAVINAVVAVPESSFT